jgi:hypothetical protein
MAINVTVVENLDNVNVNVSSQSPIINISVDQLASERAVQAAKEARESADEAKVSEDNALISAESALLSEQEANQAKEDAEFSKVEAENARDTAIEAKDYAQLSSEGAVQAKTDAESFASQASDARNEAIEAKDDAIQAKEDAELAQLGAETARDAILDKAEINLTTAGNILRADGTTYKAVNETKQNFLSNPPSSYYNIIDSFERPNSTVIGNTDNGLNWQGNLTEYEILNGFLRGLNSNFSVTPLPIYIESIINSNIFGKTIEFIYYPRGQTRSLQNLNIIIGYIDSSNYFNI